MAPIKNLLNDLNDAGVSDAKVAAYCVALGCKISQATINRLRSGVHKSTNYQTYSVIEKLYESEFRKK